jgi:hypothetical protein
MKNARTTDSNASAPYKRDFNIHDYLPCRKDTILAGVLVWLFEGVRPLTAWDGVEAFRTLHLAVAIRILKKKYRWPIETVAVPTRRPNGTTFYVTGYKLPQALAEYARDNWELQSWSRMVKLAQARKHARDGDKAAALAFYRLTTGHPDFLDVLNSYSR